MGLLVCGVVDAGCLGLGGFRLRYRLCKYRFGADCECWNHCERKGGSHCHVPLIGVGDHMPVEVHMIIWSLSFEDCSFYNIASSSSP